jgi:adenylate cyclase
MPMPARGSRHWTVEGSDRALRLLGRPGLALAFLSVLANAVPGGALFIYLYVLVPAPPGVPDPDRAMAVIAAGFAVYLAVAVPVAVVGSIRGFAPVLRWLSEDRPATAAEQRAILRQPLDRGVGGFVRWAVASVFFGILLGVLGYPAVRIAGVVIGILLAAVAATSLTALLIERLLRPVVRAALGGDLPGQPFGIRVLPRLLLSWAFGSAVPLVGLLLAPIGQGRERLSSFAGGLTFLCLAGLISGFTIITGAARAVSEPLESIRAALRRVEAGDLSVEVPVDDGGEVGQLQAGVNRMVVGLRQRRRLEDLFGRYVGAEVAEQALERGADLGGERDLASVVFVDLLGSTAMAAALDPELVVQTLNVYFAAVVGAVEAEGGWVNKFEGDGALCVFGPPGGLTDHSRRALRAALGMRAAIEVAARDHPRLDAAIGVSTGLVVAGTIGSTQRFEYTVIGDPVNEAARLTDLAKGHAGRILASAATVSTARDGAAGWVPAGSVLLRGRSERTELWQPRDSRRGGADRAAAGRAGAGKGVVAVGGAEPGAARGGEVSPERRPAP